MWPLFRTSVALLAGLTLVTGIIYPIAVTILAQSLAPLRANGSLIVRSGRVVGSEFIGQGFSRPEYFWGRLSATERVPYDAAASSGSNVGPSNPDLATNAASRLAALREHDADLPAVPVDLVTASASGLDPHISPAAAEVQVNRVAAARTMPVDRVRALVAEHTEPRQFGVLGEPRVNVLMLNLALDAQR